MGLLDDLKRKALERASQVYDQVNVLDNGLSYQTRQVNPAAAKRSALQQAAPIGRAVIQAPVQFANTSNLAARQAVEAERMLQAQLTHNAGAGLAASRRADLNYNRFANPHSGALGMGSFFKNPEEAKRGDLKTVGTRIGGGTLMTAATIAPFAKGGTLAATAGKQSLKSLAPKLAAEGAAYGTAFSAGNQLQQNSKIDPKQLVRDAAIGSVANVAVPVAARGVKNAGSAVAAYDKSMNEIGAVGKNVKAPVPPPEVPPAVPVPPAKQPLPAPTAPNVEINRFTKGGKAGRQNISPDLQASISGEHNVRNTKAMGDAASSRVGDMKLNDAVNSAHNTLAVPLGAASDADHAFVIRTIEKLDEQAQKAKDVGKNAQYEALSREATALHDGLSEHLTAKGQGAQIAALLYARTPQGLVYQAQRDLARAGVEVTPELKAELQGLANKIKTAPDQAAKERATAVFHKAMANKIPQGKVSNLVSVWKAGLLSGPKTHGGNLVSNTTFAGLRAASNPVSTLADMGMSLFTKERTKTTTLKGLPSGTGRGLKSGLDTMKTGIDPRNLDKYEQHADINFKNPIIQKVIGGPANTVFRAMNAADQPFYYAAMKNTMYDLARADGINKGLKGKALQQHMTNLVANPSEKMAETATRAAAKSVLGYDTLASKAVSGIHRGIDKATFASQFGRDTAHAAVNVLAPFVRVPSAYLSRTLDYTPIGVMKTVVGQIGRKQFDQRALSEALGEATTGSAILYLGAELAKNNMLSGQYPKDPTEQARWKAEGIQPNSIRIGNKWISLNYIGPSGLLLGAGKDFHDAAKRGDAATTAAIAGFGKNLTGQSFLTGFSGFSNAIQDPQRSAKSFVNSEVGSAIPSLVNDVAGAFDSKQRETNNPIQALQARTPGLRNNLPAKQDVYGNPLSQRTDPFNLTLNPLRPSDSKSNPVIAEVSRLHYADPNNKDLQVTPTPVDKKITVDKKEIALNDKQRHDLQTQVGQLTQQKWGELIKTPEYQALDDTSKANALDKVRQSASELATRSFVVNNSLAEYSKPASAKAAALADGSLDIASFAKNKSNGDSGQSVLISKNISGDSKKLLTAYNALSSDDRKKYYDSAPDAEFKVEKAKFENDMAAGKLTKAEAAKSKYSLHRLEVGSKFTKEVRDLYALNKTELYDVLTNDPSGNKLANDIVAYGDALEGNGLGNNKYRDSRGNVAIAPKGRSSGSGSRGGRGGKGSKGGAATNYLAKSDNVVRGTKLSRVSFANRVGSAPGIKAYAKANNQKVAVVKKELKLARSTA